MGSIIIQTQAVTYIVQRMASMAGMFYIAALYFFLKGRTSKLKKTKIVHYIFCFLFAILAFGSKENAIMLPITILLFDLMLIQGITKRNLVKYAFFLLLVISLCAMVAIALKGWSVLNLEKILNGYHIRGFTLCERLLTEPRIILLYISLIFYPMPTRLCFSHDIALSKGLFSPPTTILAILMIAGLIGFSIVKAKRWPLLCFCILFFFLNHIVESSFIPLELAFEHRNYIPSMLLFIPIAILIVKGITYFDSNRIMKAIIIGFVILVIISFGYSTYVRNFAWQTEGTLWLDAITKSPNLSRVHHNLAKFYTDIGLKQKALIQYKRALHLPDGPNRKAHYLIHYNMGLIYQSFENFALARHHFLEALALEPGYLKIYSCLGILELKEDHNEKAMQYFAKVLYYSPKSERARNQVAFVLLKQGQIDNAIKQFQLVLEKNPKNLYALTHLGVAYKLKKEFGRAIACFKKTLNLENRYVTAALQLIEVYVIEGNEAMAKKTAEALVKSLPARERKLLIEKRILHTDPLLAQANPEIVSSVIEKVIPPKAQFKTDN